MFYERKIRYLDYYEAGERIRGCGFVKLEVRDKILRLEIAIKGLREMEGTFTILLLNQEREEAFEQLELKGGSGGQLYTCRLETGIGRTSIAYGDLIGIRIPLAGAKEIACRWDEAALKFQARKEAEETSQEVRREAEETSRGEGRETEETSRGEGRETEGTSREERTETEGRYREEGKEVEERYWKERKEIEGTSREEQKQSGMSMEKKQEWMPRGESEAGGGEPQPLRLREDKWEQLCTIYPHICPFRDEREYLSIRPADFVLLPSANYRAAHNSFLLHGYYNYNHLILTRLEKKGEILYYLGVPGNYFEKEKQVAVMFGFESFECAVEPAEYGDFGYYMMRTDL